MSEQKAYEPDTGEIEFDPGDAQETEVEIPEREEPEGESSGVELEADTDDQNEQERYSDSAQKRINRLTKKMREAERQREEALRYAQQVQAEAQQMRSRMQQLDQGYLNEYGGRLKTETEVAEAQLKRAVELGDSEQIVSAQRRLSQLYSAAEKYESAKTQREQYMAQAQEAARQQPEQPQYVPQQQPQQPQQVRRPDPKAEDWATRNTWFGQDEAMTFAAFGIHKKLIEDEGFDPESDEYYSELDRRIRREFPQKFSGSGKRAAQTVAGVSRGGSASPARGKKVRLTPTQVSIANRLGVPLEKYAEYVKE